MKNVFAKSGLSVAFAVLLFLLPPVATVCTAQVAATPDGLLRQSLQQALGREGYIGSFPNGQELQRGMAAYLWDNRSWLQRVDFHSARQFDAVVCLLDKKGYPGFAEHLQSAVASNWCKQLVRQP